MTKSVRRNRCWKIKLNTILESNFPKIPSILISASLSVYLRTKSSKNISETFNFLPDVRSAEELLHEHEVETTTSFVMYYSYGVGKGKSKVRGAPQMNSAYEREC